MRSLSAFQLFGTMLFAAAGAQASTQETIRYIHTDALGSIVAVTDTNGHVIERREYEPYGAQLVPEVQDGPGYTGHVQDAETGLVYMQQRYYDAQIGRFLSTDAVNADAGDTRAFNRYAYSFNSPYKFKDQDGRWPKGLGGPCDLGPCQSGIKALRSIGPAGSSAVGDGQLDPGTRRSTQTWPTGSERKINSKDKPGEGGGRYGDCRGTRCARLHSGIDAEGDLNTKIYSFRDGIVIRADNLDAKGYGKQVVVQHADGISTKYAHLASYSVEVGRSVRQDQAIGMMGRSGNTPSGGDTHLHFEVIGPAGTQDPLDYFPELRP